MNIKSLLLLTILFKNCVSLKILALYPNVMISHYLVFEPLFHELANRGHNVTIVSSFQKEQNYPNIRFIDVNDGNKKPHEMLPMNFFNGGRISKYFELYQLARTGLEICNAYKNSKNIKSFLEENNKYDLIIVELFNTYCHFGVLKQNKAVNIGLSSTDMLPWMNQWFGNPENPSYIPTLFLDYNDEMTFLQRVENTLMWAYSKFIHEYWIAQVGNEFSKKHLGVDLYEGGDALYNISLLLLNRHFTYHTPRPLSPNVIEVGGIHIKKPKPLPGNLAKIVEGSPNGVIFMSMGSTLKGSSFPEAQRKMFIKVFSVLKQTVIWKWEDEMKDLPKNVLTQKWIPQLDMLCHPNVKLFITQGGLLSTQEAVHCGVPMLMLPQFADQHYNAAALKKTGAIALKLRTTNEEELLNSIKKLLTAESANNAKELAQLFNDRPMSPMDTAIYWIEYVAKYKGAPFMRTKVTDLSYYQYLLLDVIGFLLLIVAAGAYLLLTILKLVKKLLFKKSVAKLKKQ
ncbi:unnamed protein product [Phyllotreta striolata]|uniref:UDP-glucuronosyltransferase n=1 Tax=Phyllotreta striolata TaxID=444603 RepID=A0A9N9TQA0_PHYSR|nr:unnamed protein product [Phyllotreta striolata]